MILTLDIIKKTYAPYSDAENSIAMSRYMKNQFPFLGIKKKESAPINRELFKSYALPEGEELKKLVQALFIEPEREYHYFAMRLLEKKKNGLTSADLPFVESLLLQNSWWDSIDDLSPNIVGHIIRQGHPADLDRMMAWVQSDHFWLQRAGLLHQLKFKSTMNEDLLIKMIEHLKYEKEFFIRKAIGWILREYSKTAPDFVVSYVSTAELSKLSEREALKWLRAKGEHV
ncbi:DNA alkylation repair protein [Macrococcus brunensis]|uniref:DNA alkylation repair protein n=1 Tax=Macrococcus brunensis TaxID=198483 RepID=UPI001EF0FEB5|nr:DNA alkylation repair protein [Macrococcus brunensis]ULG72350.1 DNA alkylation repair protein [Macrococcus brunensis]ULG74611.1 DNA alkylation repair protein [Macrococcus brunensis]